MKLILPDQRKAFKMPYLYWHPKYLRHKPLTPKQAEILKTMMPREWYVSENREENAVLGMVGKGYVVAAKIAKRVDGKVQQMEPEELLMRCILKQFDDQPITMFKRIGAWEPEDPLKGDSVKTILFAPQFADRITRGEKLMTIRAERKRPILPGHLLDLRAWQGKPYRSKQNLLRTARCVSVRQIRIDRKGILVAPRGGIKPDELYGAEADAFAERDGFADFPSMIEWFEMMHGLPFDGTCIEWEPMAEGQKT